jgi:hypothetical protein
VNRRQHHAEVTLHAIGVDDRSGEQHGAASARKRSRTSGNGRGLAEEFNGDATALNVSITQQADHRIATKCSEDRRARVVIERNNGDAKRLAEVAHPIEQMRRFESFRNCHDLNAAFSKPSTRPFPATEMWEGQDDAVTGIKSSLNVLVAIHSDTGAHSSGTEVWESEALDPVLRIACKHLPRCALQHRLTGIWIDTPLMASSHREAVAATPRCDITNGAGYQRNQANGKRPTQH